jgi:RNA polymerase-binding transcription factor DksA
MNQKTIESLAKELRRQRQHLFKEATENEADLAFIAEDRESVLEERAQEERAARLFARLDIRAKHAIEDIDAALLRIGKGTYGICACGQAIPVKRLQALPAIRFCLDCARAQESGTPVAEEEEAPVRQTGLLPAAFNLMSDREIEMALRELVREDGRIDAEELRIVFRHGVVHLDGVVPSTAEHQMLLKLLTDIEGFQDVVDRLQVKEILWERAARSKPSPEERPPSRLDPTITEDVVKSDEEGIDYSPPVAPPPEEE